MSTHLVTALCFGALIVMPLAQGQTPVEAGRGLRPIVFKDVSVIPMDTERVLAHQVVLVKGGRIDQIGPLESVHVPAAAAVIDGRGKFLLPGLADMHVHVDRKEMLPLFLSSGVTTVLNMGLASPEFVIVTRGEVVGRLLPGPRIFAAFMIDGPGDPGPQFVALCDQDARGAVDRAKLLGYDFIKAYERLDPKVYAALMDEAKKETIAVVGHIPTSVGLEGALDQGQVMVAHGEEYYKTYFHNKPDETLIAPAVAMTKKAGAYVTPNLSFFSTLTETWADPKSLDARMADPENQLAPPDVVRQWLSYKPDKPSDYFMPELATLRKLTLALSQAGVPLLAGTDTPGNLIPGTSLDDDLDELVKAGLSPFQAISAATRTPDEFIHQYVPGAERFGTIAPGKSADLILVEANPLEDVRNVRHPDGVLVRGRYYDRQRLDAMVQTPVPGYKRIMELQSAFERLNKNSGAAEAIRSFRADASTGVKLPLGFINKLGYEAISASKLGEAIALFAFNVQQYPDDWNVYDSLGEAYVDHGQMDLAVVAYRRSLALNPRNDGAAKALQKMMAEPTKPN